MGRVEHLFIVRVWQEQGADQEGGQWRGVVEHLPSGQRRYFTSHSDLTAFIVQCQLAPPSASSPSSSDESGESKPAAPTHP